MIDGLLTSHLKGFSAARILDVGPGYSSFSRTAAATTGAREITYVDCDTSVLEWQKAENAKTGVQTSTELFPLSAAGIDRLPGPYDVILCQEVLEHLVDAEAVLAALARQLTPGGRMVITVPTRCSERWLKRLNPAYMKDEPHGHVREFGRADLERLLSGCGLAAEVILPTQPHYFLAHTWLFGTRMKVEGSTGRILSGGWRMRIMSRLLDGSRRFFLATGPAFWGRLLPRNYFVVATRRTA